MFIFQVVTTAAIICAALFGIMLAYEKLVTPVRPGKGERLEAVLHVSGEATELENTVRGLMYLRDSGRIHMDVVIIDEGMGEETEKTAQMLSRDSAGLTFLKRTGNSDEQRRTGAFRKR